MSRPFFLGYAGPFVSFPNNLIFLRRGVVNPTPNPQVGGHPILGSLYWLETLAMYGRCEMHAFMKER
jgi:hypothetical protein